MGWKKTTLSRAMRLFFLLLTHFRLNKPPHYIVEELGKVHAVSISDQAMWFQYTYKKMAKLFANSGDRDQTLQNLGLHCSLVTLSGVSRLKWVKMHCPILKYCHTVIMMCIFLFFRLRHLLRKLQKEEVSKEDLQKNLEYAAQVLETVYIDETR